MKIPEPEDTRTQLVRGFSWLNYVVLRSQLPDIRKWIDLYWPEWNSKDGWDMYWNIGPRNIVHLFLRVDGYCVLTLYSVGCWSTSEHFELKGSEPLLDVFMQVGKCWSTALVAHLTTHSAKES